MKDFKDCPFNSNGEVVELDGADWKPLKACTGLVIVSRGDIFEECINCKHWMFNEHIDDIPIQDMYEYEDEYEEEDVFDTMW